MSALTTLRRGRLASAVIPAVAIGIAGIVVAQAGAQAAPRHPAAPILRGGPKIALGTTRNVADNAFSEAPDGAVLYSRGSVVYVVNGDARPKIVLRAGHSVLALAATASDLFVQTGLTVTEYQRSDHAKVRHWVLPRQLAPVTMGGLFAVGGTLWSWIDTETDSSGFEFATVSRIATSASAVHLVSKDAFPAAMSANRSGLYFESTNGGQTRYFLAHASPGGSVFSRSQAVVRFGPLPLALAGGRVDLLTEVSHPDVNSYSGSGLTLLSSKRVPAGDISIASTDVGVVVLGLASTPTVSKLNVATGRASGTVRVPGAFELLPGPSAAVVETSHGLRGTMTLERITS
jgi:hypothetical protein